MPQPRAQTSWSSFRAGISLRGFGSTAGWSEADQCQVPPVLRGVDGPVSVNGSQMADPKGARLRTLKPRDMRGFPGSLPRMSTVGGVFPAFTS
jgi:hypothetical protein